MSLRKIKPYKNNSGRNLKIIYRRKPSKTGGRSMEMSNLRNNKLALKSLLMKNIKTDDKGRVLLAKDDEWREETIWDEIYKDDFQ